MKNWILDDKHPAYGKVIAMGITLGEKYRWFQKGITISMIPLNALHLDEEDND